MPSILSSTSSSGATPAQGRPSASEAASAARQPPIGRPFGVHLGRKAQPLPIAEVGRPIGDGAASAPSKGDVFGPSATGRTRPSGLEATDEDKPKGPASQDIDPLDPMTRALFAPGMRSSAVFPALPPPPPDDAVSRSSRASLDHVLNRLVRRIAWSGDAQSGSARLELGAGALEGATLTIHAEGGQVRVSLELPPGVDQALWKERIARRLGARGLQVAALEVE